MSFARNVTGLLLTSVVSIPLAFVTSVLLARYLSVEERGSYALLTTFAAVAVIFTQLGWPTATVYRLRRTRVLPAQVAATGMFAILVVSSITVSLCLALRTELTDRFLGEIPATLFFLALAMIPMQLMALLLGSLARGIDRFVIQNTYKLILNAGTLLVLSFVLVFRQGAILEVMIASLAIQTFCVLGYLTAVLRQTGFALRFDWGELRDSLVFGMKSYLQALSGQLHQRVDIFMIAYFLQDTKQVAFYAIAVGLVQQVMIIPDSIGSAAYPQLSGLGRTEGAQFVSRIMRQSLMGVVLTASSFALVAPVLVPLIYGDAYRSSVAPLLVLLPAIVLIAIYKVLSRYFTAVDRQQANIVTQLISVAVNVLLNLIWIPKYGILGAAMASLASYGVEALLISVVFMRQARLRPSEFLVPRREDLEEVRTRLLTVFRRVRAGG